MKLSVLANLYGALPLEEALKKLSALGIDTIAVSYTHLDVYKRQSHRCSQIV